MAVTLTATATATFPQSPKDGQVLPSGNLDYVVAANSNPLSNGHTTDEAITVFVATTAGAPVGQCAASYGPEVSSMMAMCGLGSILPPGGYSWRYTWTRWTCSTTASSSCTSAQMASGPFRFTVSGSTDTTTTPTTTTTVAATTTTVTVTVPAKAAASNAKAPEAGWFWRRWITGW